MAKTLDDLELRRLIGDDGPATPATPHTENARYLTSLDGFNIKRPGIPPHVFREERDRALAPGPTALVPLDLSGTLGFPGPATTPFVLSRYLRLRGGEPLETAFPASTELHYVVRGRGVTRFGPGGLEAIRWSAGDALCLPGGGAVRHEAEGDAVLWSTTNEPFLAFEGCRPPALRTQRWRP